MSETSSIALVTGGNRGIGLAIAQSLKTAGHRVVITYRSGTPPEGFDAVQMDVTSTESVDAGFAKIEAEIGQPEIIVANAGITKDNLLMRMSEEDFDKVIEINLKSVFNMTKAVQKIMLKNRKGSIVNMSSVVGVKGNAGQANYAASKAGMIGFTKSVALELGSRNIRCNAIAPGFIETEMTAKLNDDVVQGWRDSIPLKRGGTPEDVANACLFFASDMSAYVSGQVLNVCGGMLT